MIREVTLAAALALTASMAHADEPPLYLKGVLIKSVERSRVGSGIFVFWHRWTVEPRAGDTMSLFSLSLSTEEPQPSPGQLCDVRYHLGKLGGCQALLSIRPRIGRSWMTSPAHRSRRNPARQAPDPTRLRVGLRLTAPAPSLIHRPSLAAALRLPRPIIIGATS